MAGRPKKNHINLTDKEFEGIKSVIRKKGTSKTLRATVDLAIQNI